MPIKEETTLQLTKKNFTGYTYLHIFTNNETGAEVVIETAKEAYERMGFAGGEQHNPTLPGHTWKYSLGGAIKVDTANGLMADKEYVIVDDKIYVSLKRLKTGGIVTTLDAVVADVLDLTKVSQALEIIKLYLTKP